MEYALPELLTRDDLLFILQQKRQLKIPGIEEFPDDELLRIYKTYAVPLTKRDTKVGRSKQILSKRAAECAPMELEEEPCEVKKQYYSRYEMEFPSETCISEKRHFAFIDDDSLSSATKRIKIAWP